MGQSPQERIDELAAEVARLNQRIQELEQVIDRLLPVTTDEEEREMAEAMRTAVPLDLPGLIAELDSSTML